MGWRRGTADIVRALRKRAKGDGSPFVESDGKPFGRALEEAHQPLLRGGSREEQVREHLKGAACPLEFLDEAVSLALAIPPGEAIYFQTFPFDHFVQISDSEGDDHLRIQKMIDIFLYPHSYIGEGIYDSLAKKLLKRQEDNF